MLLFNNIADLAFIVNSEMRITAFYARNHELLFTTPDNFLNRKVKDIFSAEDSQFFTTTAEQVFRSEKTAYIEYHLTANDVKKHYAAEYCPLKTEGSNETDAILVMIKEISAQQEKERQYQNETQRSKVIFENVNSGIAVSDLYGNLIEFNKEYCRLLDEDWENLTGKNFRNYTHPDDAENENAHIEQVIKQKRTHYRIEKRCITAKGNVKWVDASVSVLYDGDQQPQFLIGILSNISESVYIKEKLQESNSSKDKLLSIIGHDLRSPIGSISGLAALYKNVSVEEKEQLVDMISESAEKAMYLLEDLLAWGRAQTNHVSFNPTQEHVEDMLHQARNVVYDAAAAKKINITIEAERNLIVTADRNMILTVFRNLLSNAIKFTPAGGNITCTAQKDANQVRIAVKDSGIGMEDEILKHIFSVSHNKTRYGTNNEKGTGLGLLICKEFVQKHNGKIDVESKLGKGSTFTVALPAL